MQSNTKTTTITVRTSKMTTASHQDDEFDECDQLEIMSDTDQNQPVYQQQQQQNIKSESVCRAPKRIKLEDNDDANERLKALMASVGAGTGGGPNPLEALAHQLMKNQNLQRLTEANSRQNVFAETDFQINESSDEDEREQIDYERHQNNSSAASSHSGLSSLSSGSFTRKQTQPARRGRAQQAAAASTNTPQQHQAAATSVNQDPNQSIQSIATQAAAAMAAAMAAQQLLSSAAAICGLDLASLSNFATLAASQPQSQPTNGPQTAEQLMAAAVAAASFLSQTNPNGARGPVSALPPPIVPEDLSTVNQHASFAAAAAAAAAAASAGANSGTGALAAAAAPPPTMNQMHQIITSTNNGAHPNGGRNRSQHSSNSSTPAPVVSPYQHQQQQQQPLHQQAHALYRRSSSSASSSPLGSSAHLHQSSAKQARATSNNHAQQSGADLASRFGAHQNYSPSMHHQDDLLAMELVSQLQQQQQQQTNSPLGPGSLLSINQAGGGGKLTGGGASRANAPTVDQQHQAFMTSNLNKQLVAAVQNHLVSKMAMGQFAGAGGGHPLSSSLLAQMAAAAQQQQFTNSNSQAANNLFGAGHPFASNPHLAAAAAAAAASSSRHHNQTSHSNNNNSTGGNSNAHNHHHSHQNHHHSTAGTNGNGAAENGAASHQAGGAASGQHNTASSHHAQHHHHHTTTRHLLGHHHHSSIQTQQQLLATKGYNPLAVVAGSGQQTEILTPTHLRKAKLMFFYVRYPSSSTLKECFRDVRFNKNNTAQLVKWFSNFREFYYIQMEKFAREAINDERIKCKEEIVVTYDHELINTLNNHYNKNRHIELPEVFRQVVEETLRHFFDAVHTKRDQEQSWKKAIYKIIQRLDQEVPEVFKSDAFNQHLEPS